jgi:dipeptidase E
MRLLLLSNSTCYGRGYLEHAIDELLDFLGPVRRLTFVPFALSDHEAYTARVRRALQPAGIAVDALTSDARGRRRLASAEALFVGGGNTFRLLDRLQRSALLPLIRRRVCSGMPYVGASAGTNIAAPTIRTTNDMPILQLRSFAALALVPFQINPHYLDADPGSRHMGETREARLLEYLEENSAPVVGLREGGWLRREGRWLRLDGLAGARVFRRGRAPREVAPGASLDALLGS